MVISDNIVEIQSKIKPKKTKHNNYLQQAFKLGIIKKNSTVKYKNVIVEVSVLDEHAALLYENHPYYSFYKFMLAFNKVRTLILLQFLSFNSGGIRFMGLIFINFILQACSIQ